MTLLRIMQPEDLDGAAPSAMSNEVLEQARNIVERVRAEGESAVRSFAIKFGERNAGDSLVLDRVAMRAAFDAMNPSQSDVLSRAAERIQLFAASQRKSISALTLDFQGGQMGHTIEAIQSAGCYAPAGRYPLPSSVLMTAVTARTSGCDRVVVASPCASPLMLTAAYIAGADEYLCVGGAQAIAAMTYGFEGFDRCDVIAGPGNAWVTAAKKVVTGDVGIDMLAGPSELLILADECASADVVASDLLAQAEHDVDAVPMLLTTCPQLMVDVEIELEAKLQSLETSEVARQALNNGFVACCKNTDQMCEIANMLSAEHLQINTRNASTIASDIRNAGAIFVGQRTPEVLGDYGIGPNHTLPTGGTARFQAGLSVMNFLRIRTWLRVDNPSLVHDVAQDTKQLAKIEGLAAHQHSIEVREEHSERDTQFAGS